MKLFGLGFKRYLKDKMNFLDATVVILSLIEVLFSKSSSSFIALRALRVFRTFRVLRVARLLR
jgi:hypothetical protein